MQRGPGQSALAACAGKTRQSLANGMKQNLQTLCGLTLRAQLVLAAAILFARPMKARRKLRLKPEPQRLPTALSRFDER
jgi:hypothetical protein